MDKWKVIERKDEKLVEKTVNHGWNFLYELIMDQLVKIKFINYKKDNYIIFKILIINYF